MIQAKRRLSGAMAMLLALSLAPATPGHSQQADATQEAPSSQAPPVFGVSSAVVQVDVVVRDKRGRAIRDLQASDFEVYEDGQRQQIEAFEIVSLDGLPRGEAVRAAAPEPSAPAPAAAPEPTPQPEVAPTAPAVIAFVFDRLFSPQARDTAYQAAMKYLEGGHVAGDQVGVFTIGLSLHTLQGFTPNRDLIAQAFEIAKEQANTDFASTRDEARRQDAVAQNLADQAAGAAGPAAAASLGAAASIAAAQSRMSQAFDRLERDQQGFATTNGLMAVVNGLKPIPGRKTIMFFSEGLALPANVLAQFRSVIAEANRSQVSVYTIDAGGLRTESGTRETRAELTRQVERRLRQEARGTGLGSDGPETRGLERAEDNLRLNPDAGLGQLANETGGFHIRDSNDPSKEFGRIQEDMRFHYVLSYTPTNPRYDGRFREIEVKVSRDGARIQSRKGYFAVDPDVSVPVRSFEAPALAELERDELPHAFPVAAGAFSFPEQEDPGRVAVMVNLSGKDVRYQRGESEIDDYETNFCVVVRVRDARGTEVDRLSQQYVLGIPESSLEQIKEGNVLFYKESNLPPGEYTVDAVAYDALAQRASAVSHRVVVPEPTEPRLSSLALLARAEQLPPEEKEATDNPLVYGEMMLYPNLGEPISKASQQGLGFYFTAYGQNARKANVELLQQGKSLAALPMSLPQPDEKGRIQYAGTLPLQSLSPGEFSLRVRVGEGEAAATREVPFTVTN